MLLRKLGKSDNIGKYCYLTRENFQFNYKVIQSIAEIGNTG